MHPTVLIVAVLLLHGVSGHLFQRDLPHKLTKHMQRHTRQLQSDADVDKCIDKRLEEAFRDGTFPSICVNDSEAENDDDDDDDDLNQEEFSATFSVVCRPECGNVYLSAVDDCGYFDQDDVFPRDFFIGLCGTNENGDKCYESYADTLNNTFFSEFFCYLNYTDDEQCNCRSTLLAEVGEKGCCLNLYNDILEDDEFKRSELYDACNVDLPTGCNNSPITANIPTTSDNSPTTAGDTADDSTTTEESGHGVMTQVALVPLISVLIFSVLIS